MDEPAKVPCGLCGDPDGWRGFHRAGCSAKVEWDARLEIGAERLKLKLVPEYLGAFAVWRNLAARLAADGEPEAAAHAAKVRDLIAELKGPAALAKDLEVEKMRCRVCEANAVENEAAGEYVKDVEPSVRHEAAHEIAEWLQLKELQPAREAVVDRDPSNKFYRVCWSRGLLGGEVHVYSAGWVRVTWDGDVEHMPMKGSRVYDSTFEAETFLQLAVIDEDWEGAQQVPVRETKETR